MQNIKKDLRELSSQEFAKKLAQVALDKKATDVVILDVHKVSGFTDYFVIMSGRSSRHVQGLAAAIENEVSKKRFNTLTEGLTEGQWVLLDLGDVVVHIFYHENRGFYDLENLWHDAPRIEVDGQEQDQD